MAQKEVHNESEKKFGFLKAIKFIISIFIIIIITASLGRFLLAENEEPRTTDSQNTNTIVTTIAWDQVDKEIVNSLEEARNSAEIYASEEVDKWVKDQMTRVDENFLDWYFSYWNQQKKDIVSLYHTLIHSFNNDYPTAAEKITEEFQKQYAVRVFRPEISQLRLERLAQEVVDLYVIELKKNLNNIPGKYSIPSNEWERYLDNISIMVYDANGNRDIPLSLKTISTSTIGGSVLLAGALKSVPVTFGNKISAKLAGKAVAEMATKTGTAMGAKLGVKFIGPIVGAGIIIWDVADQYENKKVNKPILRQNILDYYEEIKLVILYDNEEGIMSIIHNLEMDIIKSIDSNKNM